MRQRYMGIVLFALLMMVLMVAAGCQDKDDTSVTSTTVSEQKDSGKDQSETDETVSDEGSGTNDGSNGSQSDDTDPAVTIISPAPGSAVSGGKLKVSVQVAGFNLVDKLGKSAVAGEGHIHYALDDLAPVPSFMPTAEFEIKPGEHVLTVSLHNNDHSPLSPMVEATTKFTSK